MKLPEVYISKNPKNIFSITNGRGVTLLELMIVVGISTLLVAVFLPMGINFYKTRQLDVYHQGIVQALRRAQLKAMAMENDYSFGLYLTSEQYVLFKGSSYDNRDSAYDEVFNLSDNLEVTGLSEIVFSKLNGIPSDIGTINLTIDSQSETISINEIGRINY